MSSQINDKLTRDAAANGSTGTICQIGGPYKCNTHPDVLISFSKGQQFTACPMPVDSTKSAAAGHTTAWIMVREADSASYDARVQSGGAAF